MSTPSTPGHVKPALDQMTVEELRREFINLKVTQQSLSTEREGLTTKIEALREESVRLQQNAEIEEEHVANKLFRRLDGAERDVRKHQLLLKEEEESTHALKAQIHEVRQQQTEVENQLEEQQEYLLMQLQKKLLDVATKKSDIERELLTERQRYLEVLLGRLAVLRGVEDQSAVAANAVEGRGEDGEAAAPPVVLSASAGANTESAQNSATARDSVNASAAVQSSASSISGSHPTSTHMKVVQLEQHLNRLLADQAKAVQQATETEKRCTELSKQLTDIQNATFLDRARAAKLKEDLRLARSKLVDLDSAAADNSSCEDGSCLSTPSRSLDQSSLTMTSSMSLKERTKELLSAAPPPTST